MSEETSEPIVLDELPEPTPEPTPESSPDVPAAKPDDLRAAMSELAGTVREHLSARPTAAPHQPTQDEISELWAIYNPEKQNKDFFRKFFRLGDDSTPEQLDEAKQLFVGMHEGMMRQAIQGARNFIAIELERLTGELGPIKEYVEGARREETRGRFYGSYPGLGEPKFNKIVESVARTLDNKTFNSEDDYFKELAEGSAVAIKEILPDFDLGKAPDTKPPGKTPKLPRTSGGGGGGAGKGRHDVLQPTGEKNDIDSLETEPS